MMRSGVKDRAISSRTSFTWPQAAGNRPSGRSCNSMVRSAVGRNACAALRASSWRSAVPVSTTYRTCSWQPARLSSVPPAPSSMSSGCAPSASTASGPPGGACRCSGSTGGSARRRRGCGRALAARPGQGGGGRRGRARPVPVPDHPGAGPPVIHLLQLRALLHGVSGCPVSLVRVREDAPLGNQPHDRILHEILVLVEVIEDLLPQQEVAAVLPLAQVPHGSYLGDEPVVVDVHHVV